MALHFDILVNGRRIGHFEARRQETLIPRDGRCHYTVTVVHNGVKTVADVVPHDYRDGAVVLIARGLDAILRNRVAP